MGFFLESFIIHEDNVLENTNKNCAAKRGVRLMLTGLTKGGEGVGEMLTMADKGERRVWEMLTLADKGGGGMDPPPFLADIICEQPLETYATISCFG